MYNISDGSRCCREVARLGSMPAWPNTAKKRERERPGRAVTAAAAAAAEAAERLLPQLLLAAAAESKGTDSERGRRSLRATADLCALGVGKLSCAARG